MLTARRLYLYGVAGVALGLLWAGMVQLLRLALGVVGEAIEGAGPVAGGSTVDREALAAALALTVVGLPLWLIHWWLADRVARRPTPEGDSERRSDIRALYLAVVAGIGLAILAHQAASGIEQAIRLPADQVDAWAAPLTDIMALGFVSLGVWALHVRMRHLDVIAGPLDGGSVGLSRLYLYGAWLAGAFVALRGMAVLIETIGRAALGTLADPLTGAGVIPLANGIGLVAVGGLVWVGHHLYAKQILSATDWRGPAERASRVPPTAAIALLGASLLLVIGSTAQTIQEVVLIVFGRGTSSDTGRFIESLAGPLVTMLPFSLAAYLVWTRMPRAVGGLAGSEAGLSARRVVRLTASAIGLLFAAVGSARCLAILLDVAGGGGSVGESRIVESDLAQAVGFALAGLPFWILGWGLVERDGAADRTAEAASTARRGYLFLIVGASIIATGVAGAFVVYQVVRAIVGVAVVDFAAELSLPFGVALVGAAVFGYHLWVLRRDLALRASRPPTVVIPPTASPSEVGGVTVRAGTTGSVASEQLLLEGPADADFDAVNRLLRERLPSGYTLQVLPTLPRSAS